MEFEDAIAEEREDQDFGGATAFLVDDDENDDKFEDSDEMDDFDYGATEPIMGAFTQQHSPDSNAF